MVDQRNREGKQRSAANRQDPLSRREQIEIVLAEYACREDEKKGTATGIGNIITIAIALVMGLLLLAFEASAAYLLIALPTLILLFVSMETDRQFSVLYQVMYLSLLEERVNKLAGKKLLLWEIHGSSLRTIIGKVRFKHRGRQVTNLNSLALLLYGAVAITLFISSLAAGWFLLGKILTLSRTWSIFVSILYEAFHILFMFFILFNRFFQQRKLLRLVEEKLRDEFGDL